jgi:hypothetical protein
MISFRKTADIYEFLNPEKAEEILDIQFYVDIVHNYHRWILAEYPFFYPHPEVINGRNLDTIMNMLNNRMSGIFLQNNESNFLIWDLEGEDNYTPRRGFDIIIANFISIIESSYHLKVQIYYSNPPALEELNEGTTPVLKLRILRQ